MGIKTKTTGKKTKKPRKPPEGPARAILKPETVVSIHSKSMCDVRTIRDWAVGYRVRYSSALRIEACCRALGIPLLA
jgi:hypothetical protein